MQRTLNILKMALLKLGGVDPELAIKNKDQLESLIAGKEGDRVPDAAVPAELTRAISDVQEAQAELANRGSAMPGGPTAEFPALMLLKQKALSDLSTTEIDSILKDIDRSIAESKLLLPENASRRQRALYILKMALLDLGHVDPKLHYEIQEQLKQIQQERMNR